MQTRNDNPYVEFNYNFAVESVFTNVQGESSGFFQNEFLLMNTQPFLLMNGTNFLLME